MIDFQCLKIISHITVRSVIRFCGNTFQLELASSFSIKYSNGGALDLFSCLANLPNGAENLWQVAGFLT